MSLGLVVLILGLLYLLIVSPRFRRLAAILLAVLIVAILLFVGWYQHNQAEQKSNREAAKKFIKSSQIELVDPRVSFSNYDGRPDRMTGRIRNNSGYPLESLEIRLVFKDCSPQEQCETVDEEKTEINKSVPQGQSRDFDEYLSGSALSPKGRITWSYEILSVSAHFD
jgi:Tfp pilus assembly protein PilE